MSERVRLTRSLVLEDPQRVPDGSGGFSTSWVPLGTLWADVRAGPGRERPGDFVTLSTVGHRIVVRGAPEGSAMRPKPDQRFREGGRVYRITAVVERDALGRHLLCFAQEEVSA